MVEGTEPTGTGVAALTVSVSHLDGHAEVVLVGDLDMATSPLLRAELDRLIGAGQRQLRINASGLRFLDAAGVSGLVQAQQRVRERDGDLRLYAVRGLPVRTLTICGLLDTLTDADAVDVIDRSMTRTLGE